MRFNNLKITQRLALGFGAVLLLLCALTGVAISGLNAARDAHTNLKAMGQRSSLADEWVSHTRLNINRVMAMAKSGNDPQVDAHFKPLIAQTTDRINGLQKVLEDSVDSEQGKNLLGAVGERRKQYIAVRKAYFAALAAADPQAEDLLQTGLIPAVESYIGSMEKLQQHERELVELADQAAGQAVKTEMLIIGLMAGFALALGAVVAWLISRSVTVPLSTAVELARAVAGGDLTRSVQVDRRDELGDLLGALSTMKDSLQKTVQQVRSATDSINTASAEIASGNQDLSARTEQAASNLEETAASMEELTATVRQSADAARQANQLAASASEIAVRGGQVVSQVVTTMDEINHSSKKISDIIGVIDGIAFQTNLLALNAAVEAARAGEQGRGFAVVAGEVRNLAQRSAEAAKEIKGLIGASVDRVEAGSRLVADAGQTMSEIVGSVQRVSDIIGEITAASGEQSDGIGQVNTAVNQLDQMTQQNAALVEESAAAAESLKDQATRLAQVVSVFRIDGSNAAAFTPTVVHPAAARTAPTPGTRPAAKTLHTPAIAAPRAALQLKRPAPERAPTPNASASSAPVARPVPVKPAKVAVAAGDEGDWESF
ncbi:MAG: methyl-accepting chemotaxis protein [Hydrogenophaga sp.]|nr:methyl-accepting chemotaxis protein [Hydrogenophaga sp.]